MNERLKYPLVITAICLVAAAALGYTYALTRDRIKVSKKADLNDGLKAVLPPERESIEERALPGVTTEEPKDSEKLYIARDKSGKALAYAAIGTARGYSSTIETLVGVDLEMRIIGIRILSQKETPGLGERTREVPPKESLWQALFGSKEKKGAAAETPAVPPFQQQFAGKTENDLVLVKGRARDGEISQLTGATITSWAVVNSVKDATKKIGEALKAIEASAQPLKAQDQGRP